MLIVEKDEHTPGANEPPPSPPTDPNALAIVWNEEKTKFCEVKFCNGSYQFYGFDLMYYDLVGYFWTELIVPENHFATLEKAKNAAEGFLR